MRSCGGRGVTPTALPLPSGFLGPRASGEGPGLAAPDASRVLQVRAAPPLAGGSRALTFASAPRGSRGDSRGGTRGGPRGFPPQGRALRCAPGFAEPGAASRVRPGPLDRGLERVCGG